MPLMTFRSSRSIASADEDRPWEKKEKANRLSSVERGYRLRNQLTRCYDGTGSRATWEESHGILPVDNFSLPRLNHREKPLEPSFAIDLCYRCKLNHPTGSYLFTSILLVISTHWLQKSTWRMSRHDITASRNKQIINWTNRQFPSSVERRRWHRSRRHQDRFPTLTKRKRRNTIVDISSDFHHRVEAHRLSRWLWKWQIEKKSLLKSTECADFLGISFQWRCNCYW